jgi:thiamine biosynthesis lipoprotein
MAGRTSRALGTFCSLLVTKPTMLNAAGQLLSAELIAIDLACSRFRSDSELMMLNLAGGCRVAVSPLFASALAVALRAAEITDGDVDPTCGRSLIQLGYDRDFAEIAADSSELPLPPAPAAGWRCVELDTDQLSVRVPRGVMLDLGATAKALAADRAAEAIAAQLGCGALVNLGGDIAVAGQPPEGGWPVRVDDGVTESRGSASNGPIAHNPAGRGTAGSWRPAEPQTVVIQAGGLATSSPSVRGWRRGGRDLHHILVPGTGQPAEIYWAAVSVSASSCVDANTASTASIIRGQPAPAWLAELHLPARLVRPDGTVLNCGGWPQ